MFSRLLVLSSMKIVRVADVDAGLLAELPLKAARRHTRFRVGKTRGVPESSIR